MARAPASARFLRSRHLVSYWRGRRFFVHNYATGRKFIGAPSTAEQLDFCSTPRTSAQFAERFGISQRDSTRILATLVKSTLLESSAARKSPREIAMDKWSAWNPAAGFFHTATRHVRLADPFDASRILRAKARTDPPPPRVKRYPTAKALDLPRIDATSEFPNVLLARRTWRRFSKRPVTRESLAVLLGLTGGIHEWVRAKGQPDFALKTSPSGGALHPIELYVWARRVEGIAPGLYHYAGDRHQLELVKRHAQRVRVDRYIPTQFWYEGAAAIVFFSAVYERFQWKYANARAYRATLIEAGHQCQTFCLAATWLELAPFCTMAVDGPQVEADLRLDGISESIVYAAGVGSRPEDVRSGATPKGFPLIRTRSNRRVVKGRS